MQLKVNIMIRVPMAVLNEPSTLAMRTYEGSV